MTAERDRAARGDIVSNDPVRDSADANRPKRVAFAGPVADKPLKRSRLTDKLLLAHMFATGFPQPQAAEKRSGAKRPAKTARRLSKKS